jgi:hypothetical protein
MTSFYRPLRLRLNLFDGRLMNRFRSGWKTLKQV